MDIRQFVLSWGMLILSVLFNAYGVFVIKLRMNEIGEVKLDAVRSFFNYFVLLLRSGLVISGIITFIVAPFFFAIALSRMEISIAYPANVVLNLFFLLFFAVLILGENITLNKGIAVIFALVSVFLLYRK